MTYKQNIFLFCLAVFLFYGCSAGKENEMAETRENLENLIADAENQIDLAAIEFSLKPTTVIPKGDFDENDYRNFTDQPNKYLSEDEFIAAVKKDFFLTSKFGKPKSEVSISLNLIDVKELLGLDLSIDEVYKNAPKFTPNVLHFWDGTATNANYKASPADKELEYNYFLIDASKPIRNIDFDVAFKNYKSTGYRLDLSKPKIKVGNNWIELKSMEGGKVKINYPKALASSVAEVQGFYKDNRGLRSSGRTAYSISSQATVTWLKQTLPIYKKALEEIDQGRIKAPHAVKAFLDVKLPKKPADTATMEYSKHFFSGPVAYVMVYVRDEKPTNTLKKVTVNLLKERDEIGKEGYFVAVDGAKQLSGIVDAKGNWIINPIYDKIDAMGDEKFDVREGRIGTPKKLDAKNKKFIDLLP
ncbi:MAG: WG repeat-containing protein [Flavobacterium sp.]|nr:MAG: WG repeat-containing protein [Flavobacterium sp.]